MSATACEHLDKPIDWHQLRGEYAPMGQILAVDYGTRRLGVAVSDPEGRYALPLTTLELPQRLRAAAVAQLAEERGADTVVVGRPVRAQGEDSHLWPEIEQFAERLRARGLTVVFEDEAFTTAEAEAQLPRGKASGSSANSKDALAASILLKQYLDQRAKDT